METKDIITLIVAVYAAGLSTYVAVVQRRDKRPQIEAKLAFGFLTFGPRLSDQQLLLTAANVGERTVTLAAGGLLLPDKSQVISFANNSTDRFPHQLEAGKSMTMWFELGPLIGRLAERGHSGTVKVRAMFRDQTSREYLSSPLQLDLSQ